jgi:acetolactate synthase small subunit
MLLENADGALQRILTVVTAQSCVLNSLSAIPAAAPGQLAVTLALEGDERALSRVAKRVAKLVNVLQVSELRRKLPGKEPLAAILSDDSLQLESEVLDPLSE